MTLLKQSTAVTVKLGPFVDSTDGVTAETALTISQADIRLSKNGGAFAQTNNTAGATHDEAGEYGIPLDTTDTNTLGRLKVRVSESGALPVWAEFMVLPAMVYDSLVLGSDRFDVNVTHIGDTSQTARDIGASVLLSNGTGTGQVSLSSGVVSANAVQISGDATAADNAELFFDGTGYNAANSAIGSVTAIAAGGITASSIAADAITAAKIAADAVTKIQTGLSTLDAAGVRAAVGLASANLDTQLGGIGLIALKLDDTLEDDGGIYRFTTNALEQAPSGGGSTDWTADEREAIRTILGVPASGTTPDAPTAGALKVIDDFLDTEVAAIKAKTDNLPASPAATGDIPTTAQVADKVMGRSIEGGADGGHTVGEALAMLRNKWDASPTTLTVYRSDGTTVWWTGAITTNASAIPVTGNAPA